MNLFKYFFLNTILISSFCNCQNFNISGYISDRNSGETLIGANIYNISSNEGISSNSYGYYNISLPRGKNILTCSYIGYDSDTLVIDLLSDTLINFAINLTTKNLSEVKLKSRETNTKSVISEVNIPVKEIKKLPALLGERDILKSIQLLPGVQSGNEGTSGIYVRGGGPEQNLILLDGVNVYNSSHLFGFFSIFNDDAIKNINLIKGGFPARFGGRLSSVLEINMKDGNFNKWQTEGGLGLISGNITVQGPIIKNKTSVIISARRTWIDLLAEPLKNLIQNNTQFSGENNYDGKYFFYDLNAKINHKFSNRDRVFFSFYSGKDDFSSKYINSSNDKLYDETLNSNYNSTLNSNTSFGLTWKNITSSLRWNHIVNKKIFLNTTLLYTKYIFDNLINSENEIINSYPDSNETITNEFSNYLYSSGIEDIGIKLDLDYALNNKHYLKFGATYIKHKFFPGEMEYNASYNDISISTNAIFSEHLIPDDFYFYFEDQYKISNRLSANIGLHYAVFKINTKTYQSPQPRVSARYLLNENTSIKFSYATMQQNIHLLTNSSFGLPNDMWVPATDIVSPQKSKQFVLGLNKSFNENIFEASLEFYHKKMEDLITFSEGSNIIATNFSSWEDKIEMNGLGKSTGIELFIKKNLGKLTGWVGYTWSKTTRQFPNINLGQEYPYKFDRTHDFSIVSSYEINDKIKISGTWVYGTGNAITMPIAQYLLVQGGSFTEYFEYGTKNDYRLPAYHRLDISCNYTKQNKKSTSIWSFGIYNVYNRMNPFFILLENELVDGVRQRVAKQISLFPIMPSVKYSFKF